jgi:hypothetical protein
MVSSTSSLRRPTALTSHSANRRARTIAIWATASWPGHRGCSRDRIDSSRSLRWCARAGTPHLGFYRLMRIALWVGSRLRLARDHGKCWAPHGTIDAVPAAHRIRKPALLHIGSASQQPLFDVLGSSETTNKLQHLPRSEMHYDRALRRFLLRGASCCEHEIGTRDPA